MVNKYRKIPIIVEAMQFDGKNYADCFKFMNINYKYISVVNDRVKKIPIKTLEGTMTAIKGDYIIKGVNGEFYPCKPDIFEKTYEIISKENEK